MATKDKAPVRTPGPGIQRNRDALDRLGPGHRAARQGLAPGARCGSWATSSTSPSRSASSGHRSACRSAGRSWRARPGSWWARLFMALHATQGPTLGLPQMIQSRAQFGYRGVIVALFAMLFTYMAFNVADQVLLAQGLHGAFGWNANLVAIVVTVGAALLAIYGYDWVHRVFRWTALHPAAPGGDHHHRRDLRPGGRRGQPPRLRVQLDRIHGPVLRRGGLQHHLRGVRVRLLALPAARYPTGQDHRLRVRRCLDAGRLADRAGRLAGHPARRDRWPGRPADGRQQRDQPSRRDHRVPVRRSRWPRPWA